MSKTVTMYDVEIMWANLENLDNYGKYSVEFTNLTDEQLEKLDALGVEPKQNPEKPEKGKFITCRSKYPIPAVDKKGDLLKIRLANGSKGDVILSSYMPKRSLSGPPKMGCNVVKLRVNEALEYVVDFEDSAEFA